MEHIDKIPNNFHLLYESLNEELDIHIYFSIKSIININNPSKIYFYYYKLPSGFLWDKIKNNLLLQKINIPDIYLKDIKLFFEKNKYIIIFKNLIEYGGIYLDINSICINPIKDLLKYNFVKSKNYEIICSEKKSYMALKYYQLFTYNVKFNEEFNLFTINNNQIENYLIENLNYENLNIYDIIFSEINDYSFSDYFHLIKKSYFLSLSNYLEVEYLNKLNLNDIFNKITIYNLLVKNVLSYNYINNEISIIDKSKFNLINNIDKIYWINLEKSLKRKENMINVLNNFNIENIKINAIDGNTEENICYKYFYCETNNYPKYSNKEYAILLSHLTTIDLFSKIDKSELKYHNALILEDDISLDFINYWNTDLKNIINNAPQDYDIIMLSYFSLNIDLKNVYNRWNNEWSASAYIVNYNNLKNKINNLKNDGKWICNENDLMVSDNYIFSKLNTYIYKYPYFTFPNENDSTLHIDHLNYHRIYKNCNYITLNNIYEEYKDYIVKTNNQ